MDLWEETYVHRSGFIIPVIAPTVEETIRIYFSENKKQRPGSQFFPLYAYHSLNVDLNAQFTLCDRDASKNSLCFTENTTFWVSWLNLWNGNLVSFHTLSFPCLRNKKPLSDVFLSYSHFQHLWHFCFIKSMLKEEGDSETTQVYFYRRFWRDVQFCRGKNTSKNGFEIVPHLKYLWCASHSLSFFSDDSPSL